MANERDGKGTSERVMQVSVEDFRADSSAAFREVRERGIVTVVERDGRPRMHILRQTEPLDD